MTAKKLENRCDFRHDLKLNRGLTSVRAFDILKMMILALISARRRVVTLIQTPCRYVKGGHNDTGFNPQR